MLVVGNCWCGVLVNLVNMMFVQQDAQLWRNNVHVLFLFRACPRRLCRLMFTVGWDACSVESKAAAKAELLLVVSGDGVVAVVRDGLSELVFWLVLFLVKACNRRLSRFTEGVDVVCDSVSSRLLFLCCCCFLSKEFRAYARRPFPAKSCSVQVPGAFVAGRGGFLFLEGRGMSEAIAKPSMRLMLVTVHV